MPQTAPQPRRIVAVVLDAHADAEALVREAAWIVRERAGELRLFLRQNFGWRLWLHGSADRPQIEKLMSRWGATLVWWRSDDDLVTALRDSSNGLITEVVFGPRRSRPWQSGLSTETITAVERAAQDLQARITTELGRRKHYAQVWQDFEWRLQQSRPWFHDYVLSAFSVSLAAIVAKWIGTLIPAANLNVIFLAAVVYSASAYGLAAALFTGAFSFALIELFFARPNAGFSIDNVLLFLMFIVVAVITSNLATRLRNQAQRAERQATETRALFQMTRDIAVAADTQGIFAAIVRQCEYLFECDAALMTPFKLATTASASERSSTLQLAYPSGTEVDPAHIEAARAAFGEATRDDKAFAKVGNSSFFPLISTEGPVAILMLHNVTPDRQESEAFRRLAESLCRIAAIALERTIRKQELENARVLTQTEKLRSALLSSIAHDFGTPLASIVGAASSLVSYGSTYPADVTNELLTTIMEEGERLNRFVKNVLQMNKLESGVLTPRLQWADAGDLVGTALDASHRRLKNHEVYVETADRLPLVRIDFVLMETVLVNLLDNAAKYAPADTDINIVVRELDNTVAIDITDQGRGIAGEDLGAVFDKFYRAKHRDRTVPGTGLGLAICKGIVEAHGGTIEAISRGLGHGTTIRIRLPIVPPDDSALADV